MVSHGKVILNYGDSLIRESELQILERGDWLNDTIIGFHFEVIGKQMNENGVCARLYPPGLSQFLKMNVSDIREIMGESEDSIQNLSMGIWAVNDSTETEEGPSGTHWSLLVFSRPDDAFFHLDSFGMNSGHAQTIYRNVRGCLSPTAKFQEIRCREQINSKDCGLHVLANVEKIAKYLKEKLDQEGNTTLSSFGYSHTAGPEDAQQMRAHLIKLIFKLSKN